jgi:hypothetical protein
MMKDLASATSSPPTEFMTDSYLMRNCLEFPKPLYFGRETGLNFGGRGAVCSPMDSGESGATNCEIPFPVKFFLGVFLFGPEFWMVTLTKVNCFLVLSFHLCLFVLPQFALLLD